MKYGKNLNGSGIMSSHIQHQVAVQALLLLLEHHYHSLLLFPYCPEGVLEILNAVTQ
jgi:hypothetical protein